MNRPPFALPNVSDADVAAILRPVFVQADALRKPHSIVTAREAITRLYNAMHDANAQLTAADLEAARNHAADMRQSYDVHA